jgi:hypothetical protein
VPIVHQNIKLKNLIVSHEVDRYIYPSNFRIMISGFEQAEYWTGPHPPGSPLGLRPGVGDPDHTVVPEYPLSTPALDVWCAGQAIHRLLTGSSARIKHRWINEERRSPTAVGYKNQFLAMNLQPMNIQNVSIAPAQRDRTKFDRKNRHDNRIQYSEALAWNLYRMLAYEDAYPGFDDAIDPSILGRPSSLEMLHTLEGDWDAIVPAGIPPPPGTPVPGALAPAPAAAAIRAATSAAAMQATAAANPRFDGRDPAALAAEHAAVRDAALASFRRSRPNYVAGFEGASSPSGETLAKKPEVRVWNEMRPSAAAVRAAAAAATEGNASAVRDMRVALRWRFGSMAPGAALAAIRNGDGTWQQKLQKVEWLRRKYNLDDRSWRKFERRWA